MVHRQFWRVSFLLAATALMAGQSRAADFKELFDAKAADARSQIAVNGKDSGDVAFDVVDGGIDVKIQPNSQSGYPGIVITPATPWDASGFGHIEAKITNTGTKRLRINLRIDNDGPWQENRSSATTVGVDPGKSAVISAIFGYQYGKAAYPLKPNAITKALIFCGKMDVAQSFRVEMIRAAGPADEKPFVDPNNVATKPQGGVLLGGGTSIDATKQLVAKGGAKAALAADGKSLALSFSSATQTVDFKPAVGMWNLRDQLQVRITMKNTGKAPISPSVQLTSRGGNSAVIATSKPIMPGSTAELIVPFMAQTPWQGIDNEEIKTPELKKEFHGKEGTSTKYTSNKTTGMTIRADDSAGAKELQITSVVAELPKAPPLPSWLGKRPPVDGDWVQTFNDEFDGDTINLKTWNIYTEGQWHLGAQTHYTKDNVIVKDGKLFLRLEKKHGHHNDNPELAANDYATGWADTYGKWVQRYGYFEARMKIPTAPNSFFAFWMMPDRGLDAGPQWVRADTKKGGMEFDIMEGLSIWGPYRHDVGFHWDGYQKYHKATGTTGIYVLPDAEGFITVGMLWLPGQVVIYDNGVETARWETGRISNVESYLILDNITGGWETEPIDDAQFPTDFVIDYVRVWQRKDLASPVDGHKPNDGGPLPPKKP